MKYMSKIGFYLTHSVEREFKILEYKYRNYGRFKKANIRCKNGHWIIPDTSSFFSTYKSIVIDKIYEFRSDNSCPVIIDMGANIGLSMYYFANLFPHSIIEGYEADPLIYRYLRINTKNNICHDNLKTYNMAIWTETGKKISFIHQGADGGSIDLLGGGNTNIVVNTIDAREIIDKYKEVDMLKIDIEGSERIVIPHIKNHLCKVKNIFVEYHSPYQKKQNLSEVIDILEKAGFRIYVKSEFVSGRPFVETRMNEGYDMQLDIFGVR